MNSDRESIRYPEELLREMNTDTLESWRERIDEQQVKLKQERERISRVLEERSDE